MMDLCRLSKGNWVDFVIKRGNAAIDMKLAKEVYQYVAIEKE